MLPTRAAALLPDGRGAACHLTAEQKRTVFIEQIKPRLG